MLIHCLTVELAYSVMGATCASLAMAAEASSENAAPVTIPVNSEAKVSVPKISLRNVSVVESGKVIWKDGLYVSSVAGITGGSESADCVTFDVGSGSYSFKLSGTL